MLRNLEADLRPRQKTQVHRRTAPAVSETVSVTQMPSESRAYLTRSEESWDWADLRDYVVAEIEKRFGVFPRDSRKEYGIFNRFCNTFGSDAPRIAKYAFEVCDGWWRGAPISVNRFTKSSDEFFALLILERLEDVRA